MKKVTVMYSVLFLYILLLDQFMIEKIHLERLFQCFIISWALSWAMQSCRSPIANWKHSLVLGGSALLCHSLIDMHFQLLFIYCWHGVSGYNLAWLATCELVVFSLSFPSVESLLWTPDPFGFFALKKGRFLFYFFCFVFVFLLTTLGLQNSSARKGTCHRARPHWVPSLGIHMIEGEN